MKTSFYSDLIDSIGTTTATWEKVDTVVAAPAVMHHTFHDDKVHYVEPVSFEDHDRAEMREAANSITISSGKSDGGNDGPMLAKFLEKNKDFASIDTAPVPLQNEKDGPVVVSHGDRRTAAESFDATTFSGYETRLYEVDGLMKDVESIKFAMADSLLAIQADKYYMDGYLATENPLGVRYQRTEFTGTKAKSEYPFLVIAAENDYGARACRVFVNLQRLFMSGGYGADQVVAKQISLYCGRTGPCEGQPHAWPTPERIGIIVNNKVDAKKVRMVCDKIAETFPHLADYLNDICADADTAQAAKHNYSDSDCRWQILSALYAEVQGK